MKADTNSLHLIDFMCISFTRPCCVYRLGNDDAKVFCCEIMMPGAVRDFEDFI
jgi:hypothetical protein